MKISQRIWLLLTATKWIFIAIALPSFRLPEPPLYSSILLIIAMFVHFGLEYSTGIHWKEIDRMRRQGRLKWIDFLSFVFAVFGCVGATCVSFFKKALQIQPHDTRVFIIYAILISVSVSWILYLVLTDIALSRWFKTQNLA